MKLFLMQKFMGVPVLSGIFNTYDEIQDFKNNYWGDPTVRDWHVIEVTEEEMQEKLDKAIEGNLNY